MLTAHFILYQQIRGLLYGRIPDSHRRTSHLKQTYLTVDNLLGSCKDNKSLQAPGEVEAALSNPYRSLPHS
jgi:hypothetical protein